jgi:glycosyltransferase involved in cell wall biosynthesis
MRIGIDGHVLGKNIGGVERYVDKLVELVPQLRPQHQFTIFIGRKQAARVAAEKRPNVDYVIMPIADPIIQRSVLLPLAARKHGLDILHVQRVAPRGCGRCRILLTIHDLIPIKYPEAYPGFRNMLIRWLTPGSIRGADFITTPSQSVCDEILATYPATQAPCLPYYNGVDTVSLTPGDSVGHLGIDRPYLFSPGALETRKNVESILAALAEIEADARPLLVLSGSIRNRAYFERIKALAAELGVAGEMRYLGFVSERDLATLYALATACVTAATSEGFNLLPLEAMALGTPVLCSDIPVHRELYDGAVTFFKPHDVATLRTEILNIFRHRDTVEAVVQAQAAKCVARFSWTAMADRMARIFDMMEQERPGR